MKGRYHAKRQGIAIRRTALMSNTIFGDIPTAFEFDDSFVDCRSQKLRGMRYNADTSTAKAHRFARRPKAMLTFILFLIQHFILPGNDFHIHSRRNHCRLPIIVQAVYLRVLTTIRCWFRRRFPVRRVHRGVRDKFP